MSRIDLNMTLTNDNNMIDDYGVKCESISEEEKLMDDIKNCKCTYRQTHSVTLLLLRLMSMCSFMSSHCEVSKSQTM